MDLIKALRRRLVRGVGDDRSAQALLAVAREAIRQRWPDAPRPPDASPIKGLVERTLAALPAPVAWAEDVQAAWSLIIGPALAAHTSARGISRGTLVVQVDHPSHRFEIQQRNPARLLQAMRAELDLPASDLLRLRLELR